MEYIKDLLCINRYHVYMKDLNGDVCKIGSKSLNWYEVNELRAIFPNSIYKKIRSKERDEA